MDYAETVTYLEHLVRETYALWDPGWVTFNWRGYTYDHVRRVRGLALTVFDREAETQIKPGQVDDRSVLELASLLHDITKPYDGEYMTDTSKKRIVDDQGYWRNEMRPPSRRNLVTDLYDELGLSGLLHHESGAIVAYHLLQRRGADQALADQVAQVIRDHLQPDPRAALAGRCLYDADTVDANIGLPAFVRNIYINLHFYDERRDPGTPDLTTLLSASPLEFLRPYILSKLPGWTQGKQRDFIPRLLTAAARDIAVKRLARLYATWASLADELDNWEWYRSHGQLAVLWHFISHTNDPSIAEEIEYLARCWVGDNGATPQARQLVEQLQHEMGGLE